MCAYCNDPVGYMMSTYFPHMGNLLPEYRLHLIQIACIHQCTGTDAHAGKAAASKGKDNYKHPETYLDFWKQLLTGNLRWRWHYIFYVALVANSCWQTSRILMAHARMGAESQPVVSDFDDFDSEL